jgi:surface antigen
MVEIHISRDALSVSLDQFPGVRQEPGTGDVAFSNIKTPAASAKRRTAPKVEIAKIVRTRYRHRYLVHLGLIGVLAALVCSNSAANTHAISVRLASSQAGSGIVLDDSTVASVSADIATANGMLISNEAMKTATTKSQQVALLTADSDALANRQVVSTAGNATRDISTYTVEPGDTLSAIASKFNITTSTVMWANNITDENSIAPGQSLTILPITGLLYTVESGDTAASLASAYSANAAQILSYNNAEVSGLKPGASIIIPDGVKPQPVQQAAPTPVSSQYLAGATSGTPTLTQFQYSGNGYSFGYCTYYVATRRNIPSNWGNANQWYYNAQASGFSVGSKPIPGAIAWTGAGYYGHVAYVESVSGGMVTVSEMNYNGNWDRVTERTVPASSFSYIY